VRKPKNKCDHQGQRFYLGDVGPLCVDCALQVTEAWWVRVTHYYVKNGFEENKWYHEKEKK